MTHSISFCSAVASDWLVLRIKIIKASLGSLVYNKITKKRASNCLVPCYAKWFQVAEWPCHSHPWRSQERTVGSRKTAAKVLRTRERALDATLNEPVPRLIWMLVYIRGQHLSHCFRDLPIRWSYLQTLSFGLLRLPLRRSKFWTSPIGSERNM